MQHAPASRQPTSLIAAVHQWVTSPRGYICFVLAVFTALCLFRSFFPERPSNIDSSVGRYLIGTWKFIYATENPPLFDWLINISGLVFGKTILAVEIVRFSLLATLYFFVYAAMRGIVEDARFAALGGLALFASYLTGWEPVFKQTNSILLMAAIGGTFYALVRLDRRADIASYLLFGLATAVGIYAKYNFAIFWIALVAAALCDATLRKRLLDWRMALGLVLTAVLFSPVALRIADNMKAMKDYGHKQLRTEISFHFVPPGVSAILDMLLNALAVAVPLLIIVAVIVPRSIGFVERHMQGRAGRFCRVLGLSLLFQLVMMSAGILMFGVTRMEQRYLFIFVLVLPYLVLRLAGVSMSERQQQWLAGALAVTAMIIVFGTVIRYVIYPLYH